LLDENLLQILLETKLNALNNKLPKDQESVLSQDAFRLEKEGCGNAVESDGRFVSLRAEAKLVSINERIQVS